MRNYLLIVIVCGVAFSCGYVQRSTPTIINEVYAPTDEELFNACLGLQGVGQFIIGKTTFSQVLADKDFRKGASSNYDRQNNIYNGHWGSDFWKSKDVPYELPGSDKDKWMKKKTGTIIKQLPASISNGGFHIGELKFYPFDMAFLNDTLVAIYFYPDRDVEDEVIGHYKEKYGNGRGKLSSYDFTKYGKNADITSTRTLDEEHKWENKDIALVYEKHKSFHMEPGKQPSGSYNRSMMIYSKKRYPVFENILLGYSAEYDNSLKAQKEQTIKDL